MSVLNVTPYGEFEIDEDSKEKIKKRCAELGISTIVNFNTASLREDLRPSEVTSVMERALHKKSKKVTSHFFKPIFMPNKNDVKNAINFLELLGVFSTRNPSTNESAGEMLEYLRKNMKVSISALK